jgi:hypothetical protein
MDLVKKRTPVIDASWQRQVRQCKESSGARLKQGFLVEGVSRDPVSFAEIVNLYI